MAIPALGPPTMPMLFPTSEPPALALLRIPELPRPPSDEDAWSEEDVSEDVDDDGVG